MKKYLIGSGICIFLALFFLFQNEFFDSKQPDLPAHQVTYKLIPGKKKGYGFSIFVDNELFIRQDVIPAVSGDVSFQTRAQAEKVAKLMILKMQTEQLPTVTLQELKVLGILP